MVESRVHTELLIGLLLLERLIRLFQSVGFTLEEICLYAPCWQDDLNPSDPVSSDVTAESSPKSTSSCSACSPSATDSPRS